MAFVCWATHGIIQKQSWKRKNYKLWILDGVIGAFEEKKSEKMAPSDEKISALLPRQCIVSQVDRNNSKTASIAHLLFRFGPQWL